MSKGLDVRYSREVAYVNYKFDVARFELHNGNGLATLSLFYWLLRVCAGKWDQFVG